MNTEDGKRMTPPRGSRGHDRNGGPAGGIRRALRAMDPEYERPGYWDRLRTSVMKRASLELARRRRLARVSVAAILSGWSRRLIPVAAAAAVVAAFVIGTEVRQAADTSPPLLLEDILANEVGDGAFQAVISGQAPASPVAFMALVEGNVP